MIPGYFSARILIFLRKVLETALARINSTDSTYYHLFVVLPWKLIKGTFTDSASNFIQDRKKGTAVVLNYTLHSTAERILKTYESLLDNNAVDYSLLILGSVDVRFTLANNIVSPWQVHFP